MDYFSKPSELFTSIVKKWNSTFDNFILEDLTKILNNIENSTLWTKSEEEFSGLFNDTDLTSKKLGNTESEKNKIIVSILTQLGKIDFEIENSEVDIIGNAYEYMISQFATSAGKKAGEFYTPQAISTILSRIY